MGISVSFVKNKLDDNNLLLLLLFPQVLLYIIFVFNLPLLNLLCKFKFVQPFEEIELLVLFLGNFESLSFFVVLI